MFEGRRPATLDVTIALLLELGGGLDGTLLAIWLTQGQWAERAMNGHHWWSVFLLA